jgi:hypothetical protein
METNTATEKKSVNRTPETRQRRRRRLWIILGSILLALIIFRLLLPSIVKRYVNKTLANLDGYYGYVEDIDIHLIRGAYAINGINIQKVESEIKTPFFSAPTIDLSVEWKALWKGEIVGEIVAIKPKLIFAKGPGNEGVQTGAENDWIQTVKDLIPLRINRLEVQNGLIAYVDNYASPKIDIQLNEFQGVATNLTNASDINDPLPSNVSIRSRSTGNGKLNLTMRMNPLKEIPDMDMNFKFEDANLPALNDFLKAYANVDAERGRFSLFAEAALIDSKLNGYFKPLITDLKVLDWQKETEGFFHKIWEGIVGLGGEILENQSKDQFGSRVPVSGTIKDSKVGVWPAIFSVFGNAFVVPLQRRIDETVKVKGKNIEDLGGAKKEKKTKK